MKPSAPNEDDDMMIIGNRELSCDVHLKTEGYAVFYNYKNRYPPSSFFIVKNSECDVEIETFSMRSVVNSDSPNRESVDSRSCIIPSL